MLDNILIGTYENAFPHSPPDRMMINTKTLYENYLLSNLIWKKYNKLNWILKGGVIGMMITLIKRQNGTEFIKDMILKYGSKKELERLFNQTNNMEMLIDLENWNYFLENPNETIEKGETLVTNKINLSQLDFEVLSTIKYNKVTSIRDLDNKMHKDFKTIQIEVHKLSKNGFIRLINGNKNSKIPILNYDEIKLEI